MVSVCLFLIYGFCIYFNVYMSYVGANLTNKENPIVRRVIPRCKLEILFVIPCGFGGG